MDIILIIILPSALLIYAVLIYNRLVSDKNTVLQGWSDIEVQLKRRHDLLPKLVEAVKQYASYESATLEAVTSLRQKSRVATQVKDKAHLESELNVSISRLIAIAENYPDLKANESFQHLLENITDVEEHIQYARRFYNGAVKNLNVRIDSFPDLFIARLFNYKPAEYFEFDE